MPSSDAHSVLILDGGMSRELIRLNAPFRQPEWSALSLIEAPETVRQIHLEFAIAGADVITTNSYALVPFHLGEERFRLRGAELAALSGRLAREAAEEALQQGRKVLVAGSLPPIFGSYVPNEFKAETVHEYLDVLVKALTPYVDIWLGETLSLIAEAQAVLRVTADTGKPVWISFCPDDSDMSKVDAPCLRSGETIEKTVDWARIANIATLLFNCCRPEFMTAAIEKASRSLSSDQSTILGAYANAFLPRSNTYATNADVAKVDESLHNRRYTEESQRWIQMGARIVGGCCGIGVQHIKHLAETIQSQQDLHTFLQQ